MARPLSFAFVAASLLLSGCNTNNPFLTPPTDTSVPAVLTTENVEGTLTVNGASSTPFVVLRAGEVTAKIVALEPETATVGLLLGTWNTTTSSCQVVITNDAAVVGATLLGTATVAGNFCVRVFDVGKITGPVNFLLEISHF